MTQFLRLFSLLPVFLFPLGAVEVRVVASDLLAGYLDEPLKAFAESSGQGVTVESVGSLPAMERLRSGEADLAVIAVPDGDKVPRDGFRVLPFCYAVAIVVVNESNPLNEISLRQLGGIYGSGHEMSITSWGGLGLTGWGNRPLEPLVGTTRGSIGPELFRHAATEGNSFKPSVSTAEEAEAESLVVANPSAIAVLGRMPEKSRIKVLPVAAGGDSPAFGPSAENVHLGDYPIRLPFYVITNSGASGAELDAVVRELFSEQVVAGLDAQGFMSLPETVRRKLQVDLVR